jgi:replicative DNA helicase
MQTEVNKAAHRYAKEGLSVIWTRPAEKKAGMKWTENQSTAATHEQLDRYFPVNHPDRNIAVVCGKGSGNLEVIDVDQKHDPSGTLVDTYLGMIKDHLPELYSRLRINQTPSGGCHIFYRCDTIQGNREIAKNKGGETLIETRGEGGIILLPPSVIEGIEYSTIQDNTIPTITPQERTILFDIALSLTEETADDNPQPTPKGKATKYDGLSPFDDYCDRGDVIELLKRHGWSIVTNTKDGNSDRIHVLRPGDSKAETSGNYHKQKKTLRIFSTSTKFSTNKAYNPADVYTILECNGDKKAAYEKLLGEGFGEAPKKQQKKAAGQQQQTHTEQAQLPPRKSWIEWIEELAKNKPGNRTGYKSLDDIISLNPGAVTLIAGRPRHGKTTFMLNLFLQQTELYPAKKFLFFTYEEPAKNILIKLLNNLIDTNLSKYFNQLGELKKTNYDFIKHYLRSMDPTLSEIERGKDKLGELIDANRIEVIDANYPVEQLREIILRQAETEPIGGIFFDYVQRMKSSEKQEGIRTKIAHISDHLKDIAKDTDLPLIVGSQMNREGVGDSKKPTLENIKETGNLEDANTILSVYCEAAEKETDAAGGTYDQNVSLEIKVLKNREGEVNGKTSLSWDRYTGKIYDSTTPTHKKSNRVKADF